MESANTTCNHFLQEVFIMNKTTERETSCKLAVTAEELAGILSCGISTARRIGELAEARVFIGRRVLYYVKKIDGYLEQMSE